MKLNQIKFTALLLGVSLVTAVAQTSSLHLPPIAAGPSTLATFVSPSKFPHGDLYVIAATMKISAC